MLRIDLPAIIVGVGLAAPALAQGLANRDPGAARAGMYAVETRHTRVLFSVSHFGFTTWYGDFSSVSGSLTLNPKDPAASALEIHIPVDTISTTNTKLDGELKGDQWFDAAKYPDIVFKSTQVTVTGAIHANVTGNLTFHGVTRPVTLAVTFNGSGTNMMDQKFTVGFEVSGHLKRSDFGVTKFVPMVGDDVTLIISAAFEHV
jgi:polyisoprenoid-binding protein YceI